MIQIFLVADVQQEQAKTDNGLHELSPDEFNRILKEKKDIVLIDSRSKEEYDFFHLEGAININYTDIDKVETEIKIEKRKKIIFYCSSGSRSRSAAKALKKMGYDARSVDGGAMDYVGILFNNHDISREEYDKLMKKISAPLKNQIILLGILRMILGIVFIIIGIFFPTDVVIIEQYSHIVHCTTI